MAWPSLICVLNIFLRGGEQYVRIQVGPVRTESKIIKGDLNPVWNQVFAIGKDKAHGGTIELTVWDAVNITTWISIFY